MAAGATLEAIGGADSVAVKRGGKEIRLKQGEALDVSSIRTNVLRLLGLVHENAVVDQQTYDSEQNLTSARIRVYDTAANANAAAAISPTPYLTGLKFIYEVHAEYSGGLLSKYYMTRLQ